MKGLEFLRNASLAANEVVKPAVARTTTAKARNPETADIRVYKDGSVYPSAALVTEFDLAYRNKETAGGQAFDVFKSTQYLNTQSWPAEDSVVFIAAVDRKLPKTDLFSGSKFDENGDPKQDVLTQGANTFGKELLEYVKEVYETEPNEDGYIDLVILRDIPFNTPDGIYFIPKTVSRGEKKGETTLERRDLITLYPLVPAAMANAATEPEPVEETQAPAVAGKGKAAAPAPVEAEA